MSYRIIGSITAGAAAMIAGGTIAAAYNVF